MHAYLLVTMDTADRRCLASDHDTPELLGGGASHQVGVSVVSFKAVLREHVSARVI
jgi:hypothetical protein